ncbi:FAD-dependent oxidoreductase (plasmid) [Agrobacterium larrymoorei]|uniref:Tryptophan 2-monooxygenase n=1 Tax=Agrobacterium larrymoorei TaxID=160699 RepID=A0A4D7E6U8_9HYPH|nr:tryptophan 2-monooxygenase [Agrobacterium larrymoorei]QYA10406.1 FAD-dependent oxidoreductase [Agrobacterium larrymoorei]
MMDSADADDLRTALFNTFLKRQICKKSVDASSCERQSACKRLTSGGSRQISGSGCSDEVVAFVYVSAETLQLIIQPGDLAAAKVQTLIAVDVAPFCKSLSSALMLQAIKLLGNNHYGRDDISHFIAIAVSKNAPSKTVTLAPSDEGSTQSFTGFPLSLAGDAGFEIVAYGRSNVPKASAVSFPTIDLLYDYGAFLQKCGSGGIGFFPKGVLKPKVAIIGAGLSGLVAASELLHAGVDDLTLYEARDRIGGKLWSHRFGSATHVVAEMGAMRFPRSQSSLFVILERLGLASTGLFPNPGQVDTTLYYGDCRYTWKSGEKPPAMFRRVSNGWQAFLQEGYTDGEFVLASPNAISDAMRLGHLRQAHDFWQAWLRYFGQESFSSGIEKIFFGENPPGGERWSKPTDWDLFKLLGVGSGGFGPVFECGFIEILRLIVNGYEENVQLIYEGISELPRRLSAQLFHGTSIRQRVRHQQVTTIKKKQEQIEVSVRGGMPELYDKVVVTSGFANIQLKHLLTFDTSLLGAEVNRAVEESHMVSASKLFILTERKFWRDHQFPPCLLTTGVAKSVYCLDYDPQNSTGRGLVLVSYTWEADSHKLLAVSDKRQRLAMLRRDIGRAYPEFAKYLVPADGDYEENVVQHDWLTDPDAGGAFKLNRRGEDIYSETLFFQPFDSVYRSIDTGLYLAGCCCSFTGGWSEGAVQTGCNAACVVIHSSGGVLAEGNPLAHPWKRYTTE